MVKADSSEIVNKAILIKYILIEDIQIKAVSVRWIFYIVVKAMFEKMLRINL